MKPSPAFQFYPQDFLVGTADLSAEEVGAYIRLLCYQWAKQGLPDDDVKLAQMASCSGNAIASIRHKFGICKDGLLRNERLEKVREEQEEYRKKQANNAKEGWKHRVGNATAMPTHMPEGMPNACSSSSSSSSPSSSSSAPSTNGSGIGKEVIDYLNEKAGTNFRPVKANMDFIQARLKEGAAVGDLKAVIDAKCKEWLGKPEAKYLRPETLFNATKFNSYVGQVGTEKTEKPFNHSWDYK